jgi:hypothetical protein
MSYLTFVLLVLVAFTIGLNLGLHGVILFTWHHSSRPTQDNTATEKSVYVVPTPGLYAAPIIAPPDVIITANKSTLNKTSKKPGGSNEQTKSFYGNKHNRSLITVQAYVHKIEQEVLSTALSIDFSKPNPYANTPIVILTCNRAALLNATLASLLKVNHIQKELILIIQDGDTRDITSVIQHYDLIYKQHHTSLRIQDGGQRIALHYQYALQTAFEHFPHAYGIIIIEDDLLFAPDFYSYLINTAYMLQHDTSVFLVSAWHDNGFHEHAYDPYALRRTDYFPGLGWLLPRKLYTEVSSCSSRRCRGCSGNEEACVCWLQTVELVC